MKLQALSRHELGACLECLDGNGMPSDRTIADLLRAPLFRWGMSPKRSILQYVRTELRACGIESTSRIQPVLNRLAEIGDCVNLAVGNDLYLAPAQSRWISVGGGVSAYLGAPPPDGLSLLDCEHHDVVRRVQVGSDEDAVKLGIADVEEVSLSDWFVPPGYISHASRRLWRPVRNDEISLSGFWELLGSVLVKEGLTFGADAEIRILGGCQGEYFGRYNSLQPEGRWITDPVDGVWCAYRIGYGHNHWHPCIVDVGGDTRRVLDLYDEDEWRWAVLARGLCVGPEEYVRVNGQNIQLTFPAPNQLRAAMDIVGRPSGAWSWIVNYGGPDPWQLLAQL